MNLQLHPEAESELRSAVRWYQSLGDRLGREFFATVDTALARIAANPDSASRLETWLGDEDLRRVVLPRFPYVIVFEVIRDVTHVWTCRVCRRPSLRSSPTPPSSWPWFGRSPPVARW